MVTLVPFLNSRESLTRCWAICRPRRSEGRTLTYATRRATASSQAPSPSASTTTVHTALLPSPYAHSLTTALSRVGVAIGTYAEVLLASSKTTQDRWTVIRGNIDPGEIAAEAAMRETREKSGVVGRLREPERPLGVWTNQDKRTKTSIFMLDVCHSLLWFFSSWRCGLTLCLSLLRVQITQELDKWEEEDRLRKWFSLEEAEEALRGKAVHAKMFENLKDRLAVLMQEQKEAAERRKAAAPPEEEPRAEPEETTYSVLHTNGIDSRAAPLPPLPTHHHITPSPLPAHAPLPTHSHQQHPLHPQHQPQLAHHQHAQHQQHQQHQQHPQLQSIQQHQHQPLQHLHQHQHQHPMHQHTQHSMHHLPPGSLVNLPDMGHVSELEGEPLQLAHVATGGHVPSQHQPHTPQHQAQHPSQQHQSHPSPYGAVAPHLNLNVGTKRKLDDLSKDTSIEGIPPPPPLGPHAPSQQ